MLLGIIGASLVLAVLTLGNNVSCSIDRSSSVVEGQDVAAAHQYGQSDPKGLAKGHRPDC